MSNTERVDVNDIMREIRDRVRQRLADPTFTNNLPYSNLSSLSAELRLKLTALQAFREQIGSLPPQPPTLRASIGAVISQFLRRVLFWQYEEARTFHAIIADFSQHLVSMVQVITSDSDHYERVQSAIRTASARIDELSQKVGHIEATVCSAEKQIQRLADRLDSLENEQHATQHISAELIKVNQSVTEALNRLDVVKEQYTVSTNDLRGDIDALRTSQILGIAESREALSRLDAVRQQCIVSTDDLRSTIDGLRTSQIQNTTELKEEAARLSRYELQTRREVVLQHERINSLLLSVRRRPEATAPPNRDDVGDDVMVGLYLSLEDAFRGSPGEIRNRVREHIPVLERAGLKPGQDLVIDIGCGRGEWLGVLTENGYLTRGCDSNALMVAKCREQGLDVVQADALQFLRSLKEDSVAAVTAFHVIEHLPFSLMLEFIDASLRVLRPGGILLLETPNPQNVLVASHNFYIDPTHKKPVPMILLQFIVEARGFCNIQPTALHPYPETMLLQESSDVAKHFNEYFYGPQDYAIVATKP